MLDQLIALDASLLLRVSALGRPGWLTALMSLVSLVSRDGVVWLALGLVALGASRTDWSGLWRLCLALLMTSVLVGGAVKPWVARERPQVAHPSVELTDVRPSSPSFPSGHAANAAAGAFALSRVWPGATIPLWLLALMVSTSRIYLGVHYPADIVAGLLVGVACAYFVTGGMRYLPDDRRPTPDADERAGVS